MAVLNHNAALMANVAIQKHAVSSHNAPLKLNVEIQRLVVTNHSHSAAPRLSMATQNHGVRCRALKTAMAT